VSDGAVLWREHPVSIFGREGVLYDISSTDSGAERSVFLVTTLGRGYLNILDPGDATASAA